MLVSGFDLSLSFSLIAQSKAPLENYLAKIVFDFGIRMFDFGIISELEFLELANYSNLFLAVSLILKIL